MNETRRQPEINRWLITFTVMFPTFIEIMDTSVVNVALPHIQGSLNAGVEEVSWVLTSYLVSNAIVIPISGWLSSVFGRRRYLIFSLLLFTGASVLSGTASSLMLLVIFRSLQGLGGGGLQPLSQAILLETFPVSERGMAMAIFGMGVVLAPAIGPVVGGYLTEKITWRWIFYVNLPAGILAAFLAARFIYDPPYIKKIKKTGFRVDRWGLLLLSLGLGTLQILLDKGQRDDWFHSDFILYMTAVSGVSLAAFILHEIDASHPVVDLSVFKFRSFTAGCIIMFTGFLSVFGTLVLLPFLLEELLNYTALWAGLVLGPGGISAFFTMPITGNLLKKGVDPRYLLGIGLIVLAYSLWLMSGFDLEVNFMTLAFPRLVMGVGLGLFFVPLATAAFAEVPKEKTGNASGVFNLLRNLGGSFGVAMAETVLARRTQFNHVFLSEHVNPFNPVYQHRHSEIHGYLASQFPGAAHGQGALALIANEVYRQARMMAFNDSFRMLALLSAFLLILVFLLKKTEK